MSKIKKNYSKNSDVIPGKSNSSLILTKKCDQIIRRNKYERNTIESFNWWLKVFEDLEKDAAIPADKQISILKETFPKYFLDRIISKISTESRKFKDSLDGSLSGERVSIDSKDKEDTIVTNKRDPELSPIDSPERKQIAAGPVKSWEKIFFSTVTPETTKHKMYSDFLNRRPDRAAIWRPLPPLSLNEMNLNQKSDAITERIATDFIHWLKSLGGDEDLPLNVQSIIDMFEIGFQGEAATTLKIDMKQLASVPLKVAEANAMPWMARRAVLHNEIKKDIKAARRRKCFSAFGTHLPADMQRPPLDENAYKKWMSCDKVPENLASMAPVWQGITHLKSTKAYCEFLLLQKPDVKPPKYLVDCGMFNLDKSKDNKSRSSSKH